MCIEGYATNYFLLAKLPILPFILLELYRELHPNFAPILFSTQQVLGGLHSPPPVSRESVKI